MDEIREADFEPLLAPDMAGWRMAGHGGFAAAGDGIESQGGPGLLWYAARAYDDFVLRLAWRVTNEDDNSGVFVRIPPLATSAQPAIEHGYEVQIDERGFDPQHRRCRSPLHLTGAIYGLVAARRAAARPIGSWNDFEIVARDRTITVRLNGKLSAAIDNAARRRAGHIGLQAHHPGSAVQFRNLRACALTRAASHDPTS